MEINPYRSVPPVPKSERTRKVRRTESKSGKIEASEFASAELFSVLEEGLESLPEVRQEQLELGRRLIADPDYPSVEDLEELAGLAEKNLPAEDLSEDEA